ncbi:MAG: family 65 glycosyl hydrolase domain-containing protein [Halarsenatibacteraceae bacterium]
MKDYFQVDKWKIIEQGFNKEENRVVESVMSLGNGHLGLRGNFAEKYTGDSLQGTYIAGVYYPDKTVVGWWKIGYPESFAKVLNAVDFIGLGVKINGIELDLASENWQLENFERTLDMKLGLLQRKFTVKDQNDHQTEIVSRRFLSMDQREVGFITYQVKPLNHTAQLELSPQLDGTITNEDANYGEVFWDEVEQEAAADKGLITMKTKKTEYLVSAAVNYQYSKEPLNKSHQTREKYIQHTADFEVEPGEEVKLTRYLGLTTNRDYDDNQVAKKAQEISAEALETGEEKLFNDHKKAWEAIWEESDIVIEGDVKAQQGIRFNIFQLYQTYTGHDPRLNIGPKGFTGEKYGGATYWDTEAYCLPFYLNTSDDQIARNLLYYRYRHLEKAKENAAKLGSKGALYPMVTMNGEECHNEWEITFEEIHRNGAIVHAIKNYLDYTGDYQYLYDYGIEVAVEVSRYWADRVHYNPRKDVYMLIGVTGPNEYENNVHNNWHTNRMAAWTLEFTIESLNRIREEAPDRYQELLAELELNQAELDKWQEIIDNIYYPTDKDRDIFLQQDGYLDKVLKPASEIPAEELPLHHNWSWDRILRSCYIKQADVLQGLYFLREKYDLDTVRRNFDFYEPKTVHESSLSPCIHAILASELGYEETAYNLYLRTARLDLDNYNNDTEDGLHITSMAGTWMSIVHGFAGMKMKDGKLSFAPFIPENWQGYSFQLNINHNIISVKVGSEQVIIELKSGPGLTINLYQQDFNLTTGQPVESALVK